MGGETFWRGTLSCYRLRRQAEAGWLWSVRPGVIAGLAAAALHDSDFIDNDEPVELIWRNQNLPADMITRNQRIDE